MVKEEVRIKAMDKKLTTVKKNYTWELVDLPLGREVIGLKMDFQDQIQRRWIIQKHKARLVAKDILNN